MARSVNKVILIGNLGADPEVRYTPSKTAVANMRLATNESYKNREGELVEKTEWHSLVAWDRLAEICEQYLKKGSTIYIEGSLQTRKWQDKDGNDKYTTEIKVRDMQMLDSRGDNGGGGNYSGGGGNRGGGNYGGGGGNRGGGSGYSGGGGNRGGGSSRGRDDDGGGFAPDDDLPF